jgi:hypothetical protein
MRHYQRIHLCLFKPFYTIEATVHMLFYVVGITIQFSTTHKDHFFLWA